MSEKLFLNDWALKGEALESVRVSDRNVLALLRCIFALLAVLIILNGKHNWRPYFGFSVGVFILYAFYSICYFACGTRRLDPAEHRFSYLIDLIFFSYLILIFEFHESVFFALFLYPIIIAPRLGDARFAFIVSFLAVAAYAAVKMLLSPATEYWHREIGNGALCLLAVGCAFSYLAALEEKAVMKLKFLLDLNESWKTRLGPGNTILTNLHRMTTFFKADSALLILCQAGPSPKWMMYSATSNGELKENEITSAIADQLVSIPLSVAAAYNDATCSWWHRLKGYIEANESESSAQCAFRSVCQDLMNMLETCAFATAPYSQGNGPTGRIFLTSSKKTFGSDDLSFLMHVSRVMSVVAENMSLTEQLISKAADYERQKISRDMHDTTIQPYIGLKLALEALHRDAKGTRLEEKLSELIHMTAATVSDLRTYTTRLRERASMPGENLLTAISRQAESFARFYGIHVDVRESLQAPINGQLAAEIFQVVSEGLSNILRHTAAKKAFVGIEATKSRIRVLIGNEVEPSGQETNRAFTPRSITERVESLDGNLKITWDGGYTVIEIEIPNLLTISA